MQARVKAVCTSKVRGKGKTNVGQAKLIKSIGIEDDVHAGNWHRQVSLLAVEKIEEIRTNGVEINFGDFAENIVTEGIELDKLAIGTRIQIGSEVVLEVTEIGKRNPHPNEMFYRVGYYVMPKVGIFTKVITGGEIKTDDEIKIVRTPKEFSVGILVVSDSASRGERISTTEAIIEKLMNQVGGIVKEKVIVPDDRDKIAEMLVKFADEQKLECLITTGGTGLSPRDNTPEATLDAIDKEIPGFAEAMRMKTFQNTSRSILSRAVAGFRKETMIVNLPGSPKGVDECLDVVKTAIPHAIELIKGNVHNCGSD